MQGASGTKRAQLGKGAFAITYRVVGLAGMGASGVEEGQLYAVKTISAETLHDNGLDISDVTREVAVLTRLSSHPHIVKFYKFMSETRQVPDRDGEVCQVLEYHLIMELAEGGSLADVIKRTPGPGVDVMVQPAPFLRLNRTIPVALLFSRVLFAAGCHPRLTFNLPRCPRAVAALEPCLSLLRVHAPGLVQGGNAVLHVPRLRF
jgi:serine/threonine protein kinase